MTDAPTPESAPTAATAPTPDPQLEDAGKKALQDERKARRDADKRATELQTELDALRQQSMTDAEKLVSERVKEATTPLQVENLRLRVALAKSLPADLVDRLRGNTQDELEADADALLALFQNSKEAEQEEDEVSTFPDLGQGNRGDAPLALGSDELVQAAVNLVGARKKRG